MANLKPITAIPCVDEVPEGAAILLDVNGEAKRITAVNAKFGGNVTILTLSETTSTTAGNKTVENSFCFENGTEATLQNIFDAVSAGLVIVKMIVDGVLYAVGQITAAIPTYEDDGTISALMLCVGGTYTTVTERGASNE